MLNIDAPLILACVNGVFGVNGWVKILSYTRPKENVSNYDPLYLNAAGKWQCLHVEATQNRGRRLLMKLAGIDSPEVACRYIGCELGIRHDQLPALPDGEYYWYQLIGLRVYDLADRLLGHIVDIMETGANDVLVVEATGGNGQRILIPLLMDIYIRQVDLKAGSMQVYWCR